MFGITTDHIVQRYEWVHYSRQCPRGSGYCEDQGQYHLLTKRWRWRGRTIWRWTIDREDIPAHVWIRGMTIGGTGGWVSKFQQFM